MLNKQEQKELEDFNRISKKGIPFVYKESEERYFELLKKRDKKNEKQN